MKEKTIDALRSAAVKIWPKALERQSRIILAEYRCSEELVKWRMLI